MANPSLVRRIADEGHLIGNHSTYHARMTLLSDEGLRADVRQAGETISELAGVDPTPWFRRPFGDGHDDERARARGARLPERPLARPDRGLGTLADRGRDRQRHRLGRDAAW